MNCPEKMRKSHVNVQLPPTPFSFADWVDLKKRKQR
jgi:hypothetical protein